MKYVLDLNLYNRINQFEICCKLFVNTMHSSTFFKEGAELLSISSQPVADMLALDLIAHSNNICSVFLLLSG